MPSRLKSLELTGYKTFASKTLFSFGERITCVVGPNGSGKSNLTDAIRWVLGEQSFSLLRGKKTEDMIFAGSELRPRANVAQATVTFDNSDSWLPIEFAEVSVTRRAYRDGTNEYLLNGQRTRLRDIGELLAKVGLSQRTYTIVGQGMVDTTLSLKAEERRALFEEAAGIGIYRSKREEALRKLEQTHHNLERVHDILGEIKPRLKTLERQAQRARDHQRVKAELDGVLKTWYGYHWHAAQKNLARARQDAEAQAAALERIRGEQHALDRSLADLRGQISALRIQLGRWREEASGVQTQTETLTRQLAVADERLRAFGEQRRSLNSDVQSLESDFTAQAQSLDAARADLERLSAERDAARSELESLEALRAQTEATRKRIADQVADSRRRISDLAAQMAERNAHRAQLQSERGRLEAAITEQAQARARAESSVGQKQAALAERESAVLAAGDRATQAEATLARLTENIASAETALDVLNARLAQAIAVEGRLTARAEALSQLRQGLEGGGSGLGALRRAASEDRLAVYAELADVLQTPPELDRAIAAALGHFIHAAIVDPADSALDVLSQSTGRAALFPLSRARPSAGIKASPEPAIVGLASELVNCDDRYRPVVDALLGQTIVVRSREAALPLVAGLPSGAVAVTLDGELFYASGGIVAGRPPAADSTSALTLAREGRELPLAISRAQTERHGLVIERERLETGLKQLRADRTLATEAEHRQQETEREAVALRDAALLEFERAEAQAQLTRTQIATLESQISSANTAQQTLIADLQSLEQAAAEAEANAQTIAGQSREITGDELNAKIARRQTQAAVAARAASDASARVNDMQAALDRAGSLVQARRARLEALDAESESFEAGLAQDRSQLETLNAQISNLSGLTDPARQRLDQLESDLSAVEAAETEIRASLHAAERRHADLQLQHARKKDEIDALRRYITDDFGLVAFDYSEEQLPGPTPLPFEGIVEHLPHVPSLPEGLEDLLNRRRSQLRRMGAINPDALREFEEVKERHDFLVAQVGDLETAANHLREVIAELDALMEREFGRTFEAVAERFRETFRRLFGGGTARLVLTEPEDLTITGIDIIAKLPGRKQQGLALLSGGERALTASALLFALLQVNPPPFATLDEVDAALDEANVGRFRELLVELSQATQFVIITHNRSTVQAADTVYGISMGADSASQAISLKLDGEKVVQQ